jgi:hypothetical protein
MFKVLSGARLHDQVLQLQINTEGFNGKEIQLHNSFFHGRGRIAQPLSSFTHIIHLHCSCDEAASPQKRGIFLLARESLMMHVVLRIHVLH